MSDDTPAERIALAPWMTEPATRAVLAALGAGAARFAGGPVRDTVLGRAVSDIDIATALVPDEVTRRLAAAGINVVPTGIEHGTVTAIVPPRQFEITTLRCDVETFGRRARVVFTTRWREDAARRDFTMNALYLDAEGGIYDFVGGLADLRAGRVRFVGNAEDRIREDVLRLLRFYRFYAHYGQGPADNEARAAARALVHLLPTLSAERVAAELKKLLAARDPVPTLTQMREDRVLDAILPEAFSLDRLAALLAVPVAPDPLRRLAALVAIEPAPDPLRRLGALAATDAASAKRAARRLKLAGAERDRLAAMASPPWPVELRAPVEAQRRALYHLGAPLYRDLVLLRAAAEGEEAGPLLALAEAWRKPRFPLRGSDVTAHGVPPGPEVGWLLAAVETWWEDGDFRAPRKTCLAELDRLLHATID
jgi:poly(A) polymerase